MTTRFEKNLLYFEILNSKAAVELSLTQDAHLKFTATEKGEKNLLDKRNGLTYHSNFGALQEAFTSHSNIKDEIPNIILFGIGLGYNFLALEDWLKKDKKRKLFILEDDLAVIGRFLETKIATCLLKNPQTFLFFVDESRDGDKILDGISWSIFPEKIQFSALNLYRKYRNEDFKKLQNRLLYSIEDVHSILDEYFSYGVPFIRNFFPNLFLLPDSYDGTKLRGRFKDIPAIICGAGPSLTKHLELLKNLKDKAIIFAGGSALNALSDAGIQPHFGGGIDPNLTQYLRVRNNLSFQIPFFYRSRLFHSAARLITGPMLYLKGGDGYNITDLFERKANIKGPMLGGGHSITNFAIEIAYFLGCRPIILIGFDLAYTDEKLYAEGVEETPSSLEEGVVRQSFEGKPIKTLWKWILEAQWISDFKKDHRTLPILNATEGGLNIERIPNITFESCIKKYLNKNHDLDGLIQREVEASGKVSISPDTILKTLAKLYDSLHRSIDILDQLIDECKNPKSSSIITSSASQLMVENLENELSFKYVLDVFHRMHTKLDFYKLQFLQHPTYSLEKNNRIHQKQLLSHFIFLKNVATIHYRMIEKCIERRRLTGNNIQAFRTKYKFMLQK